MDGDGAGEITQLLKRLSAGDAAAASALYPQVYDELRKLARSHLRSRDTSQTLQPTALVHETYLRLSAQADPGSFANRKAFYALCAKAMRSIIVDHARSRGAKKRGAGQQRVELESLRLAADGPTLEVVALDEALERLAAKQPDHARVVELRFFGGLTAEEAAQVMDVSLATVERHWRLARAWLFRELSGTPPTGD